MHARMNDHENDFDGGRIIDKEYQRNRKLWNHGTPSKNKKGRQQREATPKTIFYSFFRHYMFPSWCRKMLVKKRSFLNVPDLLNVGI